MKSIWTGIGGIFVLCCLAAFLFTAEAEMQNNTFWTEAAQGGMTEVMASNSALTRATSAEVKAMAQQLVTDHTAVNAELSALAATKNVTLPSAPSEKQLRDLEKLNGRTGADFDREYLKMIVNSHEKSVKLYERESQRGTDADAKAFAAKTLPALQGHLTMARTMYDTTRGANRGNSSNNNSNPNTNSSNVNRSTNRRQDNRNTNSNGNTNSNSNNSNVNNTMMHPF